MGKNVADRRQRDGGMVEGSPKPESWEKGTSAESSHILGDRN